MLNIIYLLKSERKQLPSVVAEKIADISKDLGNIAFGSLFIPVLLEKFNLMIGLLGLASALFFWSYSVWLIYRLQK